jgi:hypothetical protein
LTEILTGLDIRAEFIVYYLYILVKQQLFHDFIATGAPSYLRPRKPAMASDIVNPPVRLITLDRRVTVSTAIGKDTIAKRALNDSSTNQCTHSIIPVMLTKCAEDRKAKPRVP